MGNFFGFPPASVVTLPFKLAFGVINGNLSRILYQHNIAGFTYVGPGQYTLDLTPAGFTDPDSIACVGNSADLTFQPGGYVTFETLSVTQIAVNFQVIDTTQPSNIALIDGIFSIHVFGV